MLYAARQFTLINCLAKSIWSRDKCQMGKLKPGLSGNIGKDLCGIEGPK